MRNNVQGGRLALSLLRLGLTLFLVFWHLSCIKKFCQESWYGDKDPKSENVHVSFGPLMMKKCFPFKKRVTKQQMFAHFHIDKTPTQETTHPCTTATFAPKHECL